MPAPTSSIPLISLRNRCTRWLLGHRPMRSVRDSLATLAALPEADGALDTYGDGALMQQLEADVAPRPIAGAAGGARQGSCRLSHAALS